MQVNSALNGIGLVLQAHVLRQQLAERDLITFSNCPSTELIWSVPIHALFLLPNQRSLLSESTDR